jgi:predicted O-methyltransferase YrrM
MVGIATGVAIGLAVGHAVAGILAGAAASLVAYWGITLVDAVHTVGRSVATVERRLEALESGQRRIVRRGRKESKATRARVRAAERFLAQIDDRHDRATFAQVEALLALYRDADPDRGLPATRGYAASPDLLGWLHRLITDTRPRLVVECGSGVSTLVAAYALRANGAGTVVAIEHEPQHADTTSRLLAQHGLTDHAEVRVSPLAPIELEGESWPWYDPDAFPDGPIDVLLVDGPPGTTRPHARFPALPILFDRLADDGVVVLDDMIRSDEREIAARWLEGFPSLELVELPHEKVTGVFELEPPS